MQYLTILGSTGSVGENTLSIVQKNSDRFIVKALVAGENVTKMTQQCLAIKPKYACMKNENAAKKLRYNLKIANQSIIVLSGEKSASELASLDEVDTVISAIVGIDGLVPTMSAIRSKKKILLANKESLISCGNLFMKEVKKYGSKLLPIDSEHQAIFQSLPDACKERLGQVRLEDHGVSKIVLTGSGGPFRMMCIDNLKNVTPEETIIHPNWIMGKKISVDSATLINKGFEYIEARWLFNAKKEQIDMLLHPQSILHGMVHYIDGSIIAQMGLPDIRISIASALAYPKKISVDIDSLGFLKEKNEINLEKLEIERYPCLKLAVESIELGQQFTIALNAANEIAVSSFLLRKIRFTEISYVNQKVLENLDEKEPKNLEEIFLIDKKSREFALKIIEHLNSKK